MRKYLGILGFTSTLAFAGTSLPIKDNADVAVTLAENNYNRIVVKNDKIMEAVFPPSAMAIKRDEQDGSVYVMLAAKSPFTLFLTTEAGRHFSLTLNSESALGKTIELVPSTPKTNAIAKSEPKVASHDKEVVPEAILAMLNAMEQQKPFSDVTVKRSFGKVERWSKGLSLLPKETWDGQFLKGEMIELYNGGASSLELSQEWFAKEGTLAIKFSKPSIAPKEHAMLYRVEGVSHG